MGDGEPLQSGRRHRYPAQYLEHLLDPSQNPPEKRPYGSKALINACKEHRHLPVFSKRTTLRKSVYDKVPRAEGAGIAREIPEVRAFEEASKVTYHEVGGFEPGQQPGEKKAGAKRGGEGSSRGRPGALT